MLLRFARYFEAPLISLLLLGVIIPIGLPCYLLSLDINYWTRLALDAAPWLLYLLLPLFYTVKWNHFLAWLDDPFGRRPDEKKAGLGIAIAVHLGLVTQFISVIVLAIIG